MLHFIENNPYVPTRKIVRHMGTNTGAVLNQLAEYIRKGLVCSRIERKADSTQSPYAIWWINNGPKV